LEFLPSDEPTCVINNGTQQSRRRHHDIIIAGISVSQVLTVTDTSRVIVSGVGYVYAYGTFSIEALCRKVLRMTIILSREKNKET